MPTLCILHEDFFPWRHNKYRVIISTILGLPFNLFRKFKAMHFAKDQWFNDAAIKKYCPVKFSDGCKLLCSKSRKRLSK